MDKVRKRDFAEARKMLEKRGESLLSTAPKMIAGHHFILENGDLRSENSINTGGRRHFTPKEPPRRYNGDSMSGPSPYIAMEIDLHERSPV